MGAGMAQQGLVKVKAQSTDSVRQGQPSPITQHLSAAGFLATAEFLVYVQKTVFTSL
jgi:hypothetical protein